ARPRILGSLLDGVSAGLRNLPSVEGDRLPRMADFAKWICAIEPSLGWEPGSFLQSYRGNVRDANSVVLESSLLVDPIRQFMENRHEWHGRATDLLHQLNLIENEKVTKDRDWPKRPNVLSGRLRRLAPNLRRIGINVEIGRGKRGSRVTITNGVRQ